MYPNLTITLYIKHDEEYLHISLGMYPQDKFLVRKYAHFSSGTNSASLSLLTMPESHSQPVSHTLTSLG